MIDRGGPILGEILDLPFEPEGLVCGSTRTTVSAIRIDEWLIGTLPGEPVTLLGDKVRELSPVPPDKTIVVGYAQGEIGYVMTAEDWLLGGYEPSITEWGPLEGEMIAEHLGELFPLAVSDARDDAAAGGATRLSSPTPDDSEVPPPDPAPMAGMVPATVPPQVYARGRVVMSQAQPPNVGRLGVTRFVWIGEDPLTGTPVVTLQRDVGGSVFADVTRPNGRRVQDGDILLFWTPQPLLRTPPRTHYWVAEWQAVPPSPELADVAGLPIGNYRFHVEGTGYSLDSAPFQVTTTSLGVTAVAGSGTLQIRVEMNGGGGFRLLDLLVDSDGMVPLRGQTVDVQLDGGAVQSVTLDDNGSATISGSAAEVRVTDRFGNSGTDAP
jgi:neutral ceramidase